MKESSISNLSDTIAEGKGKLDTVYPSSCRNPLLIGIKNTIISDTVSGIIHSFKSAVAQLPKQGPGVVWIRIPDSLWTEEKYFLQAKKLLQKELTGAQNKRVNAVFLLTRSFDYLEKNGKMGCAYDPLILSVEHNSPRVSVKGDGRN